MAASLLLQSPNLSQHLSDPSLTPLLTSASSQHTLESLTSLASTALTANAALAHLNMGAPLRIFVEYDPDPPSFASDMSDAGDPFAPSFSSSSSDNDDDNDDDSHADIDDNNNTPDAIARRLAASSLHPATSPAAAAAAAAAAGQNGRRRRRRRSSRRPASPGPLPTLGTGPILLHSFIAPTEKHDHEDPSPGPVEEPPLLVGTVVGTSGDVAGQARRAGVRLERVAREIQREWVAEEMQNLDG